MRLYFAVFGIAMMACMAKAEAPSGVVEKMLALVQRPLVACRKVG